MSVSTCAIVGYSTSMPARHRLTPRHVLLVAWVVAVAALTTGCGDDGPSKQAYESGLARVQQQMDAASKASAEAGASGADDEARAEALATAHDDLAKAAATARKLDPPEDAATAHRAFVSALEDYADLFGKLATTESGDPEQSDLYTQAGAIVKRLDRASRSLDKAGFHASS